MNRAIVGACALALIGTQRAAAQGVFVRGGAARVAAARVGGGRVVVAPLEPRNAAVIVAPRFCNPYGFYGVTTLRQVNVVYSPPPAPPVIFLPPPVVREEPVVVIRPDRDWQPEPPLPGQPAGGFRPLEPDNRARARQPVAPEPVAPAPAPPAGPPTPERLMGQGRAAFAAREYGRAADHFRRAASAAPRDGLPRLLLAQALFALGKFRDAADAARDGLALRPDWPATHFSPEELHGEHRADHADQMRRLEEILARHPDDPELLFLYAYQLWLAGRRAEATATFRRALRHGADPASVEPFLRGPRPGDGAVTLK